MDFTVKSFLLSENKEYWNSFGSPALTKGINTAAMPDPGTGLIYDHLVPSGQGNSTVVSVLPAIWVRAQQDPLVSETWNSMGVLMTCSHQC